MNNDDDDQLEDNINLPAGEKDNDYDSIPSYQSKEEESAASTEYANNSEFVSVTSSMEDINELLGNEIQNGALDTEAQDIVGNEDAFGYNQEPIDNYTEEVDSSPESAGVLDNLTEEIRSKF